MLKTITTFGLTFAVVATCWSEGAEARRRRCFAKQSRASHAAPAPRQASPAVATEPPKAVETKPIPPAPQVRVLRAEVVSGTRVTLFANFLREEQGYVLLNLRGTSTSCEIIDWRPDSVTADLPPLGLWSPSDANIQVVLPDGRIVKTIPILLVSQPDILIHEETIAQPMPPSVGSG